MLAFVFNAPSFDIYAQSVQFVRIPGLGNRIDLNVDPKKDKAELEANLNEQKDSVVV